MNWTKEIPTVDGWYWIRSAFGSYVDEINDSSLYNNVFQEWWKIDKEDFLEFYGPLEEPK